MSRRNKTVQDGNADVLLGEAIIKAAQSLGWLLPETEEGVEALEADSVIEPGLPWEIADPYSVLDAITPPVNSLPHIKEQASEDLEEELARAAREGAGEITSEVERQMKDDREAAERARILRYEE
jgi:hypothetical protein